MIRIYIDDDIDLPVVDFSGPNFSNILKAVKKLKLEYIPDAKLWTTHPAKMLDVIHELNDVEDVEIDDLTREELQNRATRVSDVRKRRTRFDRSLMKLPPIKGKPPNEDYQLTDIKTTVCTNRRAIFWQMGLGKTMLMVNVLNQHFAAGRVEKCLIVAPTEGVVNWTREIQKFSDLFPPERVTIADVKKRKPFTDDVDIVVMTYRTFLMISDDYYKETTGKKSKKYRKACIPFSSWGTDGKRMVILDESHCIKTPTSRTSKVLHIHKPFFEYRYILTGTPADKVADYYSQMTFLSDDLIPMSYYDWLSGIANLGDRFSEYNINYYYPERVESFVKRIEPYMVRRNTEDHLDLPENYIDRVYANLEGLQLDIYRSLIVDTMDELQSRGEIDTRDMLNMFPFLTLALDNPDILRDSKHTKEATRKLLKRWKFEKHGKLEVTNSLVEKYLDEGRKVILWSGHPKTIDQMSEYYAKRKPFWIHGQLDFRGTTRDKFRDELVEGFKASPDRNLLIASYKVLNSAVNLTEATRNIYFDRSYSMTEWLQSQKRTHRIGQNERVITHPIIFSNTLDERLDARLDAKVDIDTYLLERKFLSEEEWKAIFEGKVDKKSVREALTI